MKKSILLAGTAISAVLFALPAAAQNNPTLDQRVQKLEQDAAQKAADDQARATRLSTLEQQFADTVWTFDNLRPVVTSADARFQMAIRARFQFDTVLFSQESDVNTTSATKNVQFKDLASGSIVRRMYIGVEGRAFRDFTYEFRLDFGGSNAEPGNPILNLARVSYWWGNPAYANQPHFRINAGVIQPMFTHGDGISSASTTFLERADVINMATAAFGGADPRRGVELTFQQADLFYGGDNLVISAAFTGQQPQAISSTGLVGSNTADEGTQILGRAAYRLWSDGFSNVQVGMDGADILNLTGNATPGGPRTVQLRDRPEVRVDGNRLVDTGGVNATGGWLYGFEAAGNFQNFYLSGEYYKFGIDRDVNCTGCTVAPLGAGVNPGDPEFNGWYVEGSWILTGEMKTYAAIGTNNEMAVFNNPRIIKPFDLASGNWGGWELAARYSDLDLNWHEGSVGSACSASAATYGCVRGGDEKIWTAGVNWYLNNNVLMRFNYENVDVNKLSAAGAQQGQKVNIYAMRLQLTN